MLEKNKDYLEMRVSSTDCAFTQNASTTISIEGFSYDTSFRLPDPGESYVIVSKEKFEKLQESVVYYMALSTRAQYWKDKCEQLQADNEHYRELAEQWEKNYRDLLDKTGFLNLAHLVLHLPKGKTLKGIIDSREAENEKYAKCIDDMEEACQDYRNTIEDLKKKLADYETISSAKHEVIQSWKEVTVFSSCEEIEDYLVNEAECDTLQKAIASLEYSVKFARDERRDLGKKLEECEKDYISEREIRPRLFRQRTSSSRRNLPNSKMSPHISYI